MNRIPPLLHKIDCDQKVPHEPQSVASPFSEAVVALSASQMSSLRT